MINDVVLEGIVVKTWKYVNDLLFRLACYHDPDLPQKSLSDIRDAADYVKSAEIEVLARSVDDNCINLLLNFI